MQIIDFSELSNVKIIDKYTLEALDDAAEILLSDYSFVRKENINTNRYVYKKYYSISLIAGNNNIIKRNSNPNKTNAQIESLSNELMNHAFNIIITNESDIQTLKEITKYENGISSPQFATLYVSRIEKTNITDCKNIINIINSGHKYDIMIFNNVFIITDIMEMLNDNSNIKIIDNETAANNQIYNQS